MKNYSNFVNWLIIKLLVGLIFVGILTGKSFAIENKKSVASVMTDYSSKIENQIRSSVTSTAALIVDYHPRLWIEGNWGWDFNNYGSFAWRIMHGEGIDWRFSEDPANDQEKDEFRYCAGSQHGGAYGADEMYRNYDHDYGRRALEPIIAGEAQKANWESNWKGGSDWTYNLDHTADEYLADAREKLLHVVDYKTQYEYPYVVTLYGSVAYDWLVNETYTNGESILSENDKNYIREKLIAHADYLKSKLGNSIHFFNSVETDNFYIGMVGMALYEPSAGANYAAINAKAQEYLDKFDEIVDVLAVWNDQGGDGGWHGGLSKTDLPFINGGSQDSKKNAGVLAIAPVLFAHYTATGVPIHESLFSTGIMKNFAEFQVHMIRPTELQQYETAPYYGINGEAGEFTRSPWIIPMRAYSRRRFSNDSEQQKIGELGGWIRTSFSKRFTDAGSWDTLDQLMFEDKWVNPRSPSEIGFSTTRHFEKLGWVFMRSGFTSPNDLAALFISQRYRWSERDACAQNSFTLERKGELIEGFQNTIWLDDQLQREISGFPTIADGTEAYAPGSKYDVGPGIKNFESTDRYDYMFGDATNAYDKNKMEKYTRGIVWIKSNNIFVIFDRVVTKDAAIKKSWIIDPGASPESNGEKLTKIANGDGALWINRLLPEKAKVSAGDAKFEVVPDQSAKEDYFLHVMQAVDASATTGSAELVADKAQLITTENRIGIKVGGWEIFFDKSGTADISVNYTDVKEDKKNSFAYDLFQNYPNPFNPATEIGYSIPVKSHVKLAVFNVLGQHIVSLVDDMQEPGLKTVKWNGEDNYGRRVASGLYFYRLEAGDFVSVKKMMLLP